MVSELTTVSLRKEIPGFTKDSFMKNISSTLSNSQIKLKVKQLLGSFGKEIHNKRENILSLLWKSDELAGATLQHGKETA